MATSADRQPEPQSNRRLWGLARNRSADTGLAATLVAAGTLVAAAALGSVTALGGAAVGASPVAAGKVFACGQITTSKGASGQKQQQAMATLGNTRAVVSGPAFKSPYGGEPVLGHPSLQVWSGGKKIYQGPLAVPSAARISTQGAVETSNVASSGALCVASFTGSNPELGVFLGMFSGGAHCCVWADTYVVRAARVLTPPIEHDYGDPGLTLKASGGSTVLLTADDYFAYEFDSYAASGLPLKVLTVQGTKLADITKQYPGWVTSDAKIWWSAYQQAQQAKYEGRGGGLGLLAAWVADQCNLARGRVPRAGPW